jgi:DNA primase
MGLREIFQEKMSLPEYFSTYVRNEDIRQVRKVCCPIHSENTPSFFYMRDTDTFSCFGCGRAGSIIELHYYMLWLDNENTSKREALEDLAHMLGIKMNRGFSTLELDGSKLPQKYFQDKLIRASRGNISTIARIDLLNAFGNTPEEIYEVLKAGKL